MAYSGVASMIFSVRNADKTNNGEIGRLPVTVGQCASVVKASKQYGESIAKNVSIFSNLEKESNSLCKIFNGAKKYAQKGIEILKNDEVASKLGKAANFASNHVNDFIVVSSGLKVAMAKKEDRKKTLIAEIGCLLGMFAGEGWMKKNLSKYLDKIPMNKKWIPLLKGIVFVTGSITCSNFGEKLGKKVAHYWDTPLEKFNNNSQNLNYKS